jgi:hypothetical protein
MTQSREQTQYNFKAKVGEARKKNERFIGDRSLFLLLLHTLKSTGRRQIGRFFTNFADPNIIIRTIYHIQYNHTDNFQIHEVML